MGGRIGVWEEKLHDQFKGPAKQPERSSGLANEFGLKGPIQQINQTAAVAFARRSSGLTTSLPWITISFKRSVNANQCKGSIHKERLEMGTEAVRDFMNAAQEDETRRNELQAVTSDEEVLVFAERLGYTFTKEDLNAWADEM